MKSNKGFSLVELIVVIAIMAIIAGVAIPVYSGYITKAETSKNDSIVNDAIYAAQLACMEYNCTAEVTVSSTVAKIVFTGTGTNAAANAKAAADQVVGIVGGSSATSGTADLSTAINLAKVTATTKSIDAEGKIA